ncbi:MULTISPECIES: hypothetical protein [Streptomyces]|uniref:hypothetical protein n=1 Tax=Streptomyces TaxID=1883 RepID=UPI001489115E|nr:MULTISPECIES: hypothetical protein [Streptomyces]
MADNNRTSRTSTTTPTIAAGQPSSSPHRPDAVRIASSSASTMPTLNGQDRR